MCLRKLKKAFHHGSHEDLNDSGGGGGGGNGNLSSSAPASESPLSHRRNRDNSHLTSTLDGGVIEVV